MRTLTHMCKAPAHFVTIQYRRLGWLLSIAASPSRTSRMISTVRWQYGQRATLAPDTSGTTLKVPLHRLRSVDGRMATLLYRTVAARARDRPQLRCRGALRPFAGGSLLGERRKDRTAARKGPIVLARLAGTGSSRRPVVITLRGGRRASSRVRAGNQPVDGHVAGRRHRPPEVRAVDGDGQQDRSPHGARLHPFGHAAPSCGATSQARAERTGPPSGFSPNGTAF